MRSLQRTLRFIAALGVIAALAACRIAPVHSSASPLSLIPQPALIEPHAGTFHLRQDTRLIVDPTNAQALAIAHQFTARLAQSRGIRLVVQSHADARDAHGAIFFSLDARATSGSAEESYELVVDPQGIRIEAHAPHGLFNASVTLWQVLTQDSAKVDALDVPGVRIVDSPRYAWRGVMLDSARHFQPPDFIKRFIDQLALLKIDTFHWHLTDDQGWRVEIKRYPRLTEIGAWRRPAGAVGTDANGQPVRIGGFYTQDEIRDIVRYAAARYVTIVPEIDMPGHMQAAIAAYPQLGSNDQPVQVSADWGVHSDILNVDEATFAFIDNVLDEVMQLFPGTYIHVGGDEAVKDQWKASSRVQARMRELRIANEDHLQGWFIARLHKYLAAHGRRLIGWDEILAGDLPADAAVMSWRGAKGGIEAARRGHDVVMAPSPDLYLDHLQSDAPDEPSGRPDLRTLADIYAFDPAPADMDAAARAHVLGAQANLWTEHMRTPAMVEHAAFPRLAALAEVLWSPASAHDWRSFIARLAPQMARWRVQDVAAADSAFEVRFKAAYDAKAQRVALTLSNQLDVPIRYTLDEGHGTGAEPDERSAPYREPLHVAVGTRVHAASFVDGQRIGLRTQTLTWANLLRRSSDALKQCSGKLTLRLEDDAPATGPRTFFDVDLFDPCWIYTAAPLDGIGAIAVTLGQLPYNFQLWKDEKNIVPRPQPQSPGGELRVLLDTCSGATIATLPLAPALDRPALTTLKAPIVPLAGGHDLCFVFASHGIDPLWAIDAVQLLPQAR